MCKCLLCFLSDCSVSGWTDPVRPHHCWAAGCRPWGPGGSRPFRCHWYDLSPFSLTIDRLITCDVQKNQRWCKWCKWCLCVSSCCRRSHGSGSDGLHRSHTWTTGAAATAGHPVWRHHFYWGVKTRHSLWLLFNSTDTQTERLRLVSITDACSGRHKLWRVIPQT